MRDLSALPDLNLALIQTSLAWHDRQANLERFEVLLEQARGADLIILPEMFTTGFSMESETLAEAEHGPTSKWMKAQAAKLNAVITGSVIIQAADGSIAIACCGHARTAKSGITTSATCSAWPVSTTTTPPASARCSSNSRAGASGR